MNTSRNWKLAKFEIMWATWATEIYIFLVKYKVNMFSVINDTIYFSWLMNEWIDWLIESENEVLPMQVNPVNNKETMYQYWTRDIEHYESTWLNDVIHSGQPKSNINNYLLLIIIWLTLKIKSLPRVYQTWLRGSPSQTVHNLEWKSTKWVFP